MSEAQQSGCAAAADDPGDIAFWAMRLGEARAELALATSLLEEDKAARRAGGFWPKLVDVLTVTQAELDYTGAQDALEEVIEECRSVGKRWIDARGLELLEQEQPARDQLAELQLRVDDLTPRWQKLNAISNTGTAAANSLAKAERECSSASTDEFLDAVTSSKAISVMSSMSTSSASDALRAAGAALQRFSAVLPGQGVARDLGDVSDTADLVVDFVFELPIDVLSFFNSMELDQAVRRCREARAAVRRVLAPLEAKCEQLRAELLGAAAAVARLREPFEARARAEMPQCLIDVMTPMRPFSATR